VNRALIQTFGQVGEEAHEGWERLHIEEELHD
jgi:hypothetical protein